MGTSASPAASAVIRIGTSRSVALASRLGPSYYALVEKAGPVETGKRAEIVERINLLQDHNRAGVFRPVQEAGIALSRQDIVKFPNDGFFDTRATRAMHPDDRRMVSDYYRDEILGASEVIGRDLSAWLR